MRERNSSFIIEAIILALLFFGVLGMIYNAVVYIYNLFVKRRRKRTSTETYPNELAILKFGNDYSKTSAVYNYVTVNFRASIEDSVHQVWSPHADCLILREYQDGLIVPKEMYVYNQFLLDDDRFWDLIRNCKDVAVQYIDEQ